MKIEIIGEPITAKEQQAYIDHIRAKVGSAVFSSIEKIIIKPGKEFVDLEWHLSSQPFDRVRRITGYLVGTLDRFNNGKRAEERDRVKHGIEEE